MIAVIAGWLAEQGVSNPAALTYARLVGILLTIVLSALAYYLARRLLFPMIAFSLSRTVSYLDDVIAENKVVKYLSWMAPPLVIYALIPAVLDGYSSAIKFIQNAALIFMIIMGLLAINALLSGLLRRYQRLDVTREIPLTNFFQVISLIIYLCAGLLILAILLDRSPLYLLSGLGAVMAILTIAFRDPLLGLMAGIQLTTNKLVARGDFIELPKYDASGEVLRVALTTVTIRNADQSITTVPTYDLISESFKNWRGINETGVRLIRRTVLIDVHSVRFCRPELAARLAKFPGLETLAAQIVAEQKNGSQTPRQETPTNLSLFRTYLTHCLSAWPQIDAQRPLMVRQNPATADGLPLEIFAYTTETELVAYETLQAEIVEHILAVAGAFELQIFQRPTAVWEPDV